VPGEAVGAHLSGGMLMRTLQVRVHVDKEGQATFRMPREFADQEVELVVVFEPVKSAEGLGWPPGFFEETAGAWQGEPLTRDGE